MAKDWKELSEMEAWNHIEKLLGSDKVIMHPLEVGQVDVTQTSSVALDRALSCGGWPRGRIIQLAGTPSSGKTFLALVAMARWQEEHPENCCMFLDAEYTYDPAWAEKLGVDNDRVILIKTNKAKTIWESLVGRPKLNKATKKTTHSPGFLDFVSAAKGEDRYIARKVDDIVIRYNIGRLGVVVLDSIATIEVPMEETSEVGKINMSPVARFLSTELKKLTPAVSESNVVFFGINHVKTKIGQMFGNPTTTPGGAAWKHAASVMVEVAPSGSKEDCIFDENEEKVGHKLRVKITKNKVGPPNKRAEFMIDFRKGIVMEEENILDVGCMIGLFDRPTSQSFLIDGEKITHKKNVLEYISENKERLRAEVRERLLELNSNRIISENVDEDDEDDEGISALEGLGFE